MIAKRGPAGKRIGATRGVAVFVLAIVAAGLASLELAGAGLVWSSPHWHALASAAAHSM
jgi:hypothetical protein